MSGYAETYEVGRFAPQKTRRPRNRQHCTAPVNFIVHPSMHEVNRHSRCPLAT
jgi:hypothetical protein